MLRFASVVFSLAICVTLAAGRADAVDDKFLAGLRERGLYRLAEIDVREKWADETTAPDERVALAIELSRTYAEWAVASPPAARPPLWEKAHAIANELARRAPDRPRQILVDLQDALAWLAAGEVTRLEADPGRPDSMDQAKGDLRQAVRGLDRVASGSEALLREVRLARDVPIAPRLSELELAGISRHVAIQLARALRNQGLCYPPESADRVNALTRALEYLSRPGVSGQRDELGWRAELEAIACHRLLGHGDDARRLARTMLDDNPPDDVMLRIEAERVRLLLREGAVAAAVAAVEKGRTLQGRASPELDFAHLQALLAARREATEPPPTDLAGRIRSRTQSIRQAHGPGWARRAEMVVGRAFAETSGRSGETDVETLRLAAESLFRAGKADEAVATFDRAAGIATNDGDIDRAFDLAFTAAAIEQQAQRFDAARDRYVQLAAVQPDHARAAQAHRLAILCAAKSVRTASPNSEPQRRATAEYANLLAAHLEKWPESPTADSVRFWRANLHASSGAWDRAAEDYRHVRPASSFFATAALRAADCYERLLAETEKDHDAAATVRTATQHLQPIIVGSDNAWPVEWSPLQRSAALALARVQLRFAEDGADFAKKLLSAALAGRQGAEEGTGPEWTASARALLVEALLVLADTKAAVPEVERIPASSAAVLIDVARAAPPLLKRPWDARSNQRAELTLRVVGRLDAIRSELDRSQATAVDSARAAALAALGRSREAVSLYNRLADEHPADGTIHEARAASLQESADVSDRRQALDVWRGVERRSKPGGPRWFRARHARCRLLVDAGRHEEAAKLVRLTRALHPDLGGQTMRKAFERLPAEMTDGATAADTPMAP